jgi:predicted transport protein
VIVAEDITSRFLNVIALFNGFIPLVAVQMNAMRCGEQISLVCTKVLDQMMLGFEEEDEEPEVVDRSYWEKHATKDTVQLTDKLFELINTFAPSVELKYNKFYIGLAQDGRTNNFTTFQPQKNAVRLEVRMSKSEDMESQISDKGLDLTDYTNWGTYRIRLSKADVKEQSQFLRELMKRAYEEGRK